MKTTQTIELSDDDVKEAVRLWLRKNVKPKDPDEWDISLDSVEPTTDGGVDVRISASRLLP